MIEEFGARLQNLRKKKKLSQLELANELSVSKGTIQNYESGALPKGDILISLAKFFGCRIDWLLTGDIQEDGIVINGNNEIKERKIKSVKHSNGVSIPKWENPDPDNYYFVPMAETQLSAGGGEFVISEKYGDFYAFRKRFIQYIATDPSNLILMKVSGNSMEPKLEDGNSVLIDIGRRRVKSGCYYAIGFGDSMAIKELEILPDNEVRVISKNQAEYESYSVKLDDIRIIGQVVWGDRTFPL